MRNILFFVWNELKFLYFYILSFTKKEKKRVVYISGPMTGFSDSNFPAFFEAEKKLKKLGFNVCNPARNGVKDDWTWEEYLKHDLKQLLKCNSIALLPGWEHSKGAELEYHVAKALDYHVIYINL